MHPQSSRFLDTGWFEAVLEKTLLPGLFFVGQDRQLVFLPSKEETIAWEIFRGQLLDSRHTREQQTFLSRHVAIEDSEGTRVPLLTIRISPSSLHHPPATDSPPLSSLLATRSTFHVTRWLRLRVWEAFDDNGAIGSRETERWVEELVDAVSERPPDTKGLAWELRLLVFHAFVGLSRLPPTRSRCLFRRSHWELSASSRA